MTFKKVGALSGMKLENLFTKAPKIVQKSNSYLIALDPGQIPWEAPFLEIR